MSITIRHNRTEGTLVFGTAKGDGAAPALKSAGFRPSRNLPEGAFWYLPHSRDKAAQRRRITETADALRTHGFDVEIDIDDTTPGRSFAEAEEERYEQAAQRADRYGTYASNAAGRTQAHEQAYRAMAEQWPPGQPLISDAARRSHARMMAADERAQSEGRKASHWSSRADTAARYQSARQDIPTTLRRIKKLEAQQRQLERELEGRVELLSKNAAPPEGAVRLEDTPWGTAYRLVPVGDHRARLEADLFQVTRTLAYWRDHVAHAEQEGAKVWSAKDFVKGDFVRIHGTWVEVLRVNPKSLTVPWAHLWVGQRVYTRADAEASQRGRRPDGRLYTDLLPYDKVTARASAEDIRRRFPDRDMP
ncbi:DUF3560 domain-containing protein [Nocardiopsis sp. FR4]|uniref:DUF3560 domain-containing protein n=1 Tax=Nocardiopsis sp. FR4 TaxID=2605985 RepID=UPI00135B9420|nr:DUF3560 domain-containing protein [Nocardiopsis sp. FR4]